MASKYQMNAVDSPSDFGDGPESLVKRWMTEINASNREFQSAPRDWFKTGDKIVKRYRDERSDELSSDTQQRKDAKFNILWANVQLLQPALYSRIPKPEVFRRFKDRDKVARAAAQLLERSISYVMDTQDFDDVMNSVVQDRLLPGRGQAWVRYVPTMETITPKTDVTKSEDGFVDGEGKSYNSDQVETGDNDKMFVSGEPYDEVSHEKIVVDYVYWKDFGHTTARNWGEVRAVWRKIYMTRTQLRERFGEKIGNAVPLNFTPKGIADTDEVGAPNNETFKKAIVYEVWDKETKKVYWISEKYESGPIDMKDDPLGLEGFFPCPKPLYATKTTDSMVPVPDYVEYFDQAVELDTLTSRMQRLMRALKLSGVYNSAIKEGLQQMLDSPENNLIGVDSWAMFGEGGGMRGNIEFMPMKEVADTLLVIGNMRDGVKKDLYEITGLSDIMRGASKTSETATAQRLKGQYGSLRLKTSVNSVQRFARDIIRIIGEVVAEQFSPDTILDMAGMDMPMRSDVEQAKAAIAELEARDEKLKQLPPDEAQKIKTQVKTPNTSEINKLRDTASDVPFEEAIALLEDQGVRTFRLDIETDSTIIIDEEAERKDRIEFLTAASNFMKMSVELGAAVPEYVPLLGKMMMFGLRGFKTGRQLEDDFEDTLSTISQRIDDEKDKPPAQDPRVAIAMKELELKTSKQQFDQTMGEAKMKLEAEKNQIVALNDRTGHEITKEKVRAETDKSTAGTEADMIIAKAEIELKARELAIKEAELSRPVADDTEKLLIERQIAQDKMEFDAAQNELDRQAELAKTILNHTINLDEHGMTDNATANDSAVADAMVKAAEMLAAPKRVIRDENDKVVGVEVVQ